MKFDKETLVFIAICVVILIVGRPIARSFGLIPPVKERDESIAVWTAENKPKDPFRILKNDEMILTIKPEEGKISRITLPRYLDATRRYRSISIRG